MQLSFRSKLGKMWLGESHESDNIKKKKDKLEYTG